MPYTLRKRKSVSQDGIDTVHNARRQKSVAAHGSGKQSARASDTIDNVDTVKKLLKKRPVGKGEFGKTYRFEDKVVKIIKIQSAAHKKAVKEEVEMHKRVQKFNLPSDKGPCVPTIHGRLHFHVIGKTEYGVYSLDALEKYKPSIGFDRILEINRLLVDNGFLHNDLHQANVMVKDGQALVIDIGMMRHMPISNSLKLDRDIMDCIFFAQTAALVDNCNENTKCPTQTIFDLLSKSRKTVISTFGLKLYKTYKKPISIPAYFSNYKDIQKLTLRVVSVLKERKHVATPELVLQLVLACLSTKYIVCEHQKDIEPSSLCEEGDETDFVYAIRAPSLHKNLSIEQLFDIMLQNRKLPQLL